MKFLVRIAMGGAGLALSIFAFAQEPFPSGAVRILVPFAAGGGADVYARVIGQELSTRWKQPVVVENKVGASGQIAMQTMLAAPRDGYTITIVSSSHAINPLLNAKLPYDTHNDFIPITQVAQAANVLVVPAASPYRSARELVEDARKRPGGLSYGMAGNGTSAHLAGELLKYLAKIEVTAVPYKGGMPFMTDLMAGHVPYGFSSVPETSPFVKSGKMRALAVTTRERAPLLPEVPTLAESGVAGYDSAVWWGMVAPAGVPDAVIRKLNADLVAVLRADVVKRKIEEGGAVVVANSPEAFKALISSEERKWAPVIKAANIRAE